MCNYKRSSGNKLRLNARYNKHKRLQLFCVKNIKFVLMKDRKLYLALGDYFEYGLLCGHTSVKICFIAFFHQLQKQMCV